jgi:pimeloyl-ACP methyl ester carboxylesterase
MDMLPDPRISAGFASLLVFLVTVHPLQGQYLPEGAEDWYLMTDDGHRVYVVELETLETAGHNVWMDRPDEFRAALLRALEGGPGSSH